jgi:hypothetical protein
MKTTRDIADAVLNDARRIAAAEGTTLRALIEDGLRHVLAERERRPAFRLRRATFGGTGLQPHVAEGSWQQIRELAYEGRGA